jgi:hypothetical protein
MHKLLYIVDFALIVLLLILLGVDRRALKK